MRHASCELFKYSPLLPPFPRSSSIYPLTPIRYIILAYFAMRPTIFLLLVAGAYGARIHVRGEDTSATTTSTGSTSSTPSN